MTKTYRIGLFLTAAIIVVALGALAGWYYFVRQHIDTTTSMDAARGLGEAPSFGSPTGSTFENAVGTLATGASNVAATEGKAAPRLWRITQTPVAGFHFASSTPRILFVETSTGNVLEADPLTSEIVRRSNTLFPKAFDAQFSANNAVVLRFVESDTVRTYAAHIATSSDATSTVGRLAGTYLSERVLDIVPGAKETLVALVQEGGGASLIQSDWNGEAQKKLVTLPLSAWDLSLTQDRALVITQKPADNIAGYSYLVGSNGSLTPLVENVPGLIVNAKSATTLLYSTDGVLYARVNGSTVALPISTLADKCVWTSGSAAVAYCAAPRVGTPGITLEERYQGVRHTNDTWYRVDLIAGTTEEVYTLTGSREIDVEKPTIDLGNRFIAFTNAADKSLYLFRIAP